MHEVGQGGSSAGQFQWVTGEAIDYTNWQASHPEYNGNTRAVYVTTINTNNLGKWYDWRDDPNSKCNGYILELPPLYLTTWLPAKETEIIPSSHSIKTAHSRLHQFWITKRAIR